MLNGLEIYSDIGVSSEVLGASAYRQIQMLLEKLLKIIPQAIMAIDNKDIPQKCKSISAANSIVIYLRECLDFSADNDLATRLDRIYNHLEKQLFSANASNNKLALKKCEEIVSNLKTWWDKLDA